ncbi:MAG: hypothetical protein OEV30_08925 [Ignavibacteria bacterium]|nr:hypothetical protein [Ignavibacteria bacterium]
MQMLKRSGYVVLSFLLTITILSCTDAGDPAGGEETPVVANPAAVNITPGGSAVVQVSGGRPPYFISDAPDPSVATASLGDSTQSPVTLTINAAASAVVGTMTDVSVGDADEASGSGAGQRVAHGDNEVTIDITISASAGVSFAADVQPIFDARCAFSGCHAGGSVPFGLDLSDAAESYSNLVNVNAGASECNGEPRVAPGSSATSVLYKRIAGDDCGARMPWTLPPTVDSLTTAQQNAIRDWIDDGALNN